MACGQSRSVGLAGADSPGTLGTSPSRMRCELEGRGAVVGMAEVVVGERWAGVRVLVDSRRDLQAMRTSISPRQGQFVRLPAQRSSTASSGRRPHLLQPYARSTPMVQVTGATRAGRWAARSSAQRSRRRATGADSSSKVTPYRPGSVLAPGRPDWDHPATASRHTSRDVESSPARRASSSAISVRPVVVEHALIQACEHLRPSRARSLDAVAVKNQVSGANP